MNLSNEIKAFLLDIDGTLINRKLEMSENTKKALKILKDKGYHLSINTGRPAFAAEKVLEKNGVADLMEYYFGYNGVEVFDFKTRETKYIATLTPDILKDLDLQFRDNYLALCTYGPNACLQFNHFPKNNEKYQIWSDLRLANPVLYDYQNNTLSFAKAVLLFDIDLKEDFLNKMKDFKDDRVDYFFSGDRKSVV